MADQPSIVIVENAVHDSSGYGYGGLRSTRKKSSGFDDADAEVEAGSSTLLPPAEEEEFRSDGFGSKKKPLKLLAEPQVEVLLKPLDPYEEKRRQAEKMTSAMWSSKSNTTKFSTRNTSGNHLQSSAGVGASTGSSMVSASGSGSSSSSSSTSPLRVSSSTIKAEPLFGVEEDTVRAGEDEDTKSMAKFLESMNRIEEILNSETTKNGRKRRQNYIDEDTEERTAFIVLGRYKKNSVSWC